MKALKTRKLRLDKTVLARLSERQCDHAAGGASFRACTAVSLCPCIPPTEAASCDCV